MSGDQLSDDTHQALADVIHGHRWIFGGGTATGAWWRCACGKEGSARSGLREDADYLGACHVADIIAAAISLAIDRAGSFLTTEEPPC